MYYKNHISSSFDVPLPDGRDNLVALTSRQNRETLVMAPPHRRLQANTLNVLNLFDFVETALELFKCRNVAAFDNSVFHITVHGSHCKIKKKLIP